MDDPRPKHISLQKQDSTQYKQGFSQADRRSDVSQSRSNRVPKEASRFLLPASNVLGSVVKRK